MQFWMAVPPLPCCLHCQTLCVPVRVSMGPLRNVSVGLLTKVYRERFAKAAGAW